MISGLGSNMNSLGMMGNIKPNSAQLADKIFSKLDLNKQGFVTQADFSSALSNSGSVTSAANVESAFKSLDTSGDGQITKAEFEADLKSALDGLQSQMSQMASMSGMGHMGGMPPPPMGGPPPPPMGMKNSDDQNQTDTGLTVDQLSSIYSDMSSSVNVKSLELSDLKNIIDNFSVADTNSDGGVTRQEAFAYKNSSENMQSVSGSSSSNSTNSQDILAQIEAGLFQSIMQMSRASNNTFSNDSDSSSSNSPNSSLSSKKVNNHTKQNDNSEPSFIQMMLKISQSYGQMSQEPNNWDMNTGTISTSA